MLIIYCLSAGSRSCNLTRAGYHVAGTLFYFILFFSVLSERTARERKKKSIFFLPHPYPLAPDIFYIKFNFEARGGGIMGDLV